MAKIYADRTNPFLVPGPGPVPKVRPAVRTQQAHGDNPYEELARADRFGHHLASIDPPQASISTSSPAQLMFKQSLITNYGKLVSAEDRRQPLIVNYVSDRPTTFDEALEHPEHPSLGPGFHPEGIIEIEHSGSTFSALANGIEVGELTIYEDDAGAWINNVSVKDSLQGRGIGSKMVEAAVESYGALYASSANKQQEDDHGDDGDTRHLSEEGAALVASCIRKGIMKDSWYKYPYSEF
jgi:ribosomal protein S18 acetylase RimI-like enzyme